MPHKVKEKLEKIWEYTPQWKRDVESRIKEIMGDEGSEINTEKIQGLYQFLMSDGVQHIVSKYYNAGEGLSEEIIAQLEHAAMGTLPSYEEIKAHFGNLKSVSHKDLDDWIREITETLDGRLASVPLAKFRRTPVEEGRAALSDIVKGYGIEEDFGHIHEPDQLHNEAQMLYGHMKSSHQLKKRYKSATPSD